MIVHHRKYSKRSTFASIVILIVIGLIFSILTACSKEEKGEKQDEMKNRTTSDSSKTLQPVNADKSIIAIRITKEGEIWIEGEKIDLYTIKSRMEDLKKKFPDGKIIVGKDKDSPSKIVTEVSNLVSPDEIRNVVVHVTKE